jgi:hypothetical protein
MRRSYPHETFTTVAVLLLLLCTAISVQAQESGLTHKGRVIISESGIERLEDVGVQMHTTYQIFVPANRDEFGADPNGYALPESFVPLTVGPLFSGYAFETPASIACLYKLVTPATGWLW